MPKMIARTGEISVVYIPFVEAFLVSYQFSMPRMQKISKIQINSRTTSAGHRAHIQTTVTRIQTTCTCAGAVGRRAQRSLTAKFAATAETQSVLHELEEKMRRIDLDASMLSDEVLLKSAHQLKTAGMKLDGGGKRVDDIEINRYQLLHDDPSFIVLTETKFSFRCIPVWDRYSPHRTRVEKKAHVIMLSP